MIQMKSHKDVGTVKVILLRGLDNDDQALLDEHKTPAEPWRYLKSKYSKPSKLAAAQYTKELNNIEFSSGLTIMDAWNKLKEIRRKIVSAKPSAKEQYDDEALILILISALPKVYQSTVDSLNINMQLSVDEQLYISRIRKKDSDLPTIANMLTLLENVTLRIVVQTINGAKNLILR